MATVSFPDPKISITARNGCVYCSSSGNDDLQDKMDAQGQVLWANEAGVAGGQGLLTPFTGDQIKDNNAM